jgi:hypothetical protein
MSADQTQGATPAKSGKKIPPFGWAVKISAITIALVASFVLAELLLRLMARFDASELTVMEQLTASGLYAKEELRTDLPHFVERQGANCITIQTGLHWDPRFGYVNKMLNKDCARRLFAAHKKSVVLLGGSAMENNQAPNYLTTLDSYAFGGDASYASINLAESGARHFNMLARFLYEVVELRPTYAVFLDGFNEFTSIRYGGKPEDDFYWTAGVNDRVHRPFLFLRDKLVDSSRLLTMLAVRFHFINSARIVRTAVDTRLVEQAASYYLKIRDYTEVICQTYGIVCIFILQPTSLVERHRSKTTEYITQSDLKDFPFDQELYIAGYNRILREAGGKIRDASRLFEGEQNVYLDPVHFNKRGSQLMGEYIRAAVESEPVAPLTAR